jgi:TPR repeat protein
MEQKIKNLIEKAETKDKDAMLQLGKLYLYGREGLELDADKAFYLFKQSVDSGNIEGYFYIAKMCLVNKYGIKDIDKAINFLQRASKRNHMASMFQLAKLYYYGKAIPKDIEKAEDLFRKVANSDFESSEAKYLLAYIWEHGLISDFARPEEAFQFYLKAAEENHSESLFKCGLFYLNGIEDYLEININKSIDLFKKASELNHFESKNYLSMLYIEESKSLLQKTSVEDPDAKIIYDLVKNLNTNILK